MRCRGETAAAVQETAPTESASSDTECTTINSPIRLHVCRHLAWSVDSDGTPVNYETHTLRSSDSTSAIYSPLRPSHDGLKFERQTSTFHRESASPSCQHLLPRPCGARALSNERAPCDSAFGRHLRSALGRVSPRALSFTGIVTTERSLQLLQQRQRQRACIPRGQRY